MEDLEKQRFEVYKEVYRKILEEGKKTGAKFNPDGHECTVKCSSNSLQDTFEEGCSICLISGNMHSCVGECTGMEIIGGYKRVCKITGREMEDLFFLSSNNRGNNQDPSMRPNGSVSEGSLQERDDGTTKKKGKKRKKEKPAWEDISNTQPRKPLVHPTLTHELKSLMTKRIPKDVDLENFNFSVYPRTLLKDHKLPETHHDKFIIDCKDTWKMVIRSPVFRSKPHAYTYRHHCWSVLFYAHGKDRESGTRLTIANENWKYDIENMFSIDLKHLSKNYQTNLITTAMQTFQEIFKVENIKKKHKDPEMEEYLREMKNLLNS